MPDSMEIRVLFVMIEEIRTDSIKKSFGDDPREGDMRHIPPDRHDDDQRHPAHEQVEQKGQARMATQSNHFSDYTGNHAAPEETEQYPSYPSAHHLQAD